MNQAATIGNEFKEKLAMQLSPVGFRFTDKKPEGAVGYKKGGTGCIFPLIFTSAKGKTVAFDRQTRGWDCSGFYLGYEDWIFEGIEYFLTSGPSDRDCERLSKTPESVKRYLKQIRISVNRDAVAEFRLLEQYKETEEPELVIFFVNPDQLSALTFLLYYRAPEEDERIITRFASACGAVITLPLYYARKGEKKAVMGLHDITARSKVPRDLLTLTVPYSLVVEMWEDIEGSFLGTKAWEKVTRRMEKEE